MSGGVAGPVLVVAIDGVDPGTAMAADLEELASLRPGARLKVILTTDRPEELVKAPNGRGGTALSAHATRIELGPLGLDEFRAVGLTRASLANIESGRQKLMLHQIYKLATALKVDSITDLVPPSFSFEQASGPLRLVGSEVNDVQKAQIEQYVRRKAGGEK
jgi:transcriptional regulator with XRE-family HTH domain